MMMMNIIGWQVSESGRRYNDTKPGAYLQEKKRDRQYFAGRERASEDV